MKSKLASPTKALRSGPQRVVAVEGHPDRFDDRIDHEEQRRHHERDDEQQADRAVGQGEAGAHVHSHAR